MDAANANLNTIIGQIERLPDEQRGELFAWLISQLEGNGDGVPGCSLDDPAFEKEIDRRIAEIETGAVRTYSLEEVKGYVDERLREARSHS